MNTDNERVQDWTAKLLARMFNWVGGITPADSSVFLGSVKYGFATYEFCNIRVHRQTRLHSTELLDQHYGDQVRRGELTWDQVIQRNGKFFQVETAHSLIETVVDARLCSIPLTEARQLATSAANVYSDKEFVLDHLILQDFVFVGHAREYRNLVTMALFSHV